MMRNKNNASIVLQKKNLRLNQVVKKIEHQTHAALKCIQF